MWKDGSMEWKKQNKPVSQICKVTSLSSIITSFVKKSAPIVALYWLEKRLLTYWFIKEVLPTLQFVNNNGQKLKIREERKNRNDNEAMKKEFTLNPPVWWFSITPSSSVATWWAMDFVTKSQQHSKSILLIVVVFFIHLLLYQRPTIIHVIS